MRIVIVGDGKVGLLLTQMLTAESHEVTVVDSNSKVLERMQEECDAMAVHGHGASRAVLDEAGAGEADVLIAATSSDEVNLLSCLLAKKMGCQSTIARVRNPVYAEDMELLREEMGLTFTINPEVACAREIFRILQIPSFMEREPFAEGRVELVRFKIGKDSPLVDVMLSNLHGKVQLKVLVCAVDRDGELIIPNGAFVLREGDSIFVTAASAGLTGLIKYMGLATHKVTQVTIVGGGRLGFYLGFQLIRSGVGVKIIEREPQRCLELSEQLPEADIVQGDGTEEEVLLAESVNRGDAMVALTGIDEENIVLSIYARQIGVPITITKCNRSQYTQMFNKMGIDIPVSPKVNCAEEIVRYVRAMENGEGGEMTTMYQLAGGKAEALEFRADIGSRVTGVPLARLNLIKGILIACISRGRDTIIPTGSSVIRPGDKVVVVLKTGRGVYALNDILEH